jgi:hypothetical protein
MTESNSTTSSSRSWQLRASKFSSPDAEIPPSLAALFHLTCASQIVAGGRDSCLRIHRKRGFFLFHTLQPYAESCAQRKQTARNNRAVNA